MRLVVLASALIFLYRSDVAGEPVQLDRGISPNGQFCVAIDPNPDGSGNDQLQIRTQRGEVVARFGWYAVDPDVNLHAASVLWNPDSTAFALNWYEGKNWTGSRIYAKEVGKWLDISQPFKRPNPEKGEWLSPGAGCYIALEWLPGDILKMDFDEGAYRMDESGQRVVAKPLWVYLQFLSDSHGPRLRVQKTEAYSAESN